MNDRHKLSRREALILPAGGGLRFALSHNAICNPLGHRLSA